MLDINFIRENKELIRKTAKVKGSNFDIDELCKIDEKRRKLIQESDGIKAKKNQSGKEIAGLQGSEKEKKIKEMQELGEVEKKLDKKLEKIEKEYLKLMLTCPQPTAKDTPIGASDKDNLELYRWGEVRKFDFEPKDHITLGLKLDIIDLPRAAKISGARSYFLKKEGALLEHAVLQYTIHKLVKKGFQLFSTPQIVNYEAMMGTSYFPGGEKEAYAVGVEKERGKGIESDEKYLIGTSEVPVTSYHSQEILNENDLPKLYMGFSSCYRREAGSYGKDTHGLYRVHQFQKVEQVIICKNDASESRKMHEFIRGNAEEILKDLNLPYRVVSVCTGDMGQGQYYKNDIETYMPSRNNYGETHSCSTFHEFQARRLNLRYKDSQGKIRFVHTLNNTAIASPRILIAILENYQNKDGSVEIPAVLQPFMASIKKIG